MIRTTITLLGVLVAFATGCAGTADAAEPETKPATGAAREAKPEEMPRVTPEVARKRVSEAGALLVCAYDSDAAYASVKLGGSIPLSELRKRLPDLDKRQEIIFFCA